MRMSFGINARRWHSSPPFERGTSAGSQAAKKQRYIIRPARERGAVNNRVRALFDHLIGDGEQRRRNLDPQQPSGLHVEDELEFGRLNYR